MNGREQVEQYAKLWEADELAGFRVGDLVRLPSIPAALEVVELKPPSLLVLAGPNGTRIKAGWRVCSKVK